VSPTTIVVLAVAALATCAFLATRLAGSKRNLGEVSQNWLAEDRASESNHH
jgi:hypothetical protein